MAGLSIIEREISRTNEREKTIALLVDNIRSQQLNFFEEAEAIQNLIEHCGLTQEEAAAKLGRVQSTIANKLRLLRLTLEERETIVQFKLTERHARSLLRIASPEDRMIMLDRIIDEGLNVDKTEQLIDEFIGGDNHKQRYKKRTGVLRSVGIFMNTIKKAVESMKAVGIKADIVEEKGEDYIEYKIRIPVNK